MHAEPCQLRGCAAAGRRWGPHGGPRPPGPSAPATCSPSPEVQSYCGSKGGDCPLKPQMPDGPVVPGVFLSPPGSVPSLRTGGNCRSPATNPPPHPVGLLTGSWSRVC